MTIAIVQLYRILGRFEKGPADDPTCRLTPEGAALDAYLCSADKPTVAFGCTYHPDGTPVRMGDSITEDQVYPYTEAAVARVIADVKRIVKRPLNEYQMAALCSFVFNLGGGNLAQSQSLLPAIEAGRWEDAADSMGEFMRAWGKLEGKWHRKAERGLLIRRYAEGCLLLGLDWAPWCNTDNIKLKEELVWQPNWVDPKGVRTGGRYFDEVLETTTQFHTIEAMARATPLPSLELVLTQPAPPLVATTRVPDGKAEQPGADPQSQSSAVSAPKVSPAPTPPSPAKKPEAVDPAPPAQLPSRAPVPATIPKPAQPPVVAGQDGTKPKSPWTVQPEDVHYKIDPGAGLKPLEDSDRAKAFYWQRTFMFVIYLGGAGLFGNAFKAGSEVLMSHAALMSVVLDLIVPLAITLSMIVVGAVGKSWADWRRHRAQQKASQGLY